MKRLFLPTLIATLALPFSLALAQTEADAESAPSAPDEAAEVIEKPAADGSEASCSACDKPDAECGDCDKKGSAGSKQASCAGADWITATDTDKSGDLSLAEITAIEVKRAEMEAKRRFASMDLDENGVITQAELNLLSQYRGGGDRDRREQDRGRHSSHNRGKDRNVMERGRGNHERGQFSRRMGEGKSCPSGRGCDGPKTDA